MKFLKHLPLAALLGFFALPACMKKDEYKKYLQGGEIIYSAVPDSLKIFSGQNRVMVNWKLQGDPKVTKARIYWNNGLDSEEIVIKHTNMTDYYHIIIDALPEGPMVFTVRTFDDAGNGSVPVQAAGQIYGDNYISSLQNRAYHAASFIPTGPSTGQGMINWASLQQFAVGEEVHYTDVDGNHQMVFSPASDAPTFLPDYQGYTLFHYTTLFLPDSTAIDTFRARFDTGFIAGIGAPPGRVKGN